MNYDLDKVFLSQESDGSVLHVYADRANKTGPRSVCLVRDFGMYICEMTGNPASLEFKAEETRPVTRDEANWLLTALRRAEDEAEMGFGPSVNVRKLYRNVREATFWVRFQSEKIARNPA